MGIRVESYHEVNLKMRLTRWSEGINTPVLQFVISVLLASHQAVVDPWKSDHFEQGAAQGTRVVPLILSDGRLIHRTGAEHLTIQTVSILDPEDVGQNRMIEQVLTNMG